MTLIFSMRRLTLFIYSISHFSIFPQIYNLISHFYIFEFSAFSLCGSLLSSGLKKQKQKYIKVALFSFFSKTDSIFQTKSFSVIFFYKIDKLFLQLKEAFFL